MIPRHLPHPVPRLRATLQAGVLELHLWVHSLDKLDVQNSANSSEEAPTTTADGGGVFGGGGSLFGGPSESREPLPGSPFTVHVSEGPASATGSFVKEAEPSSMASKQERGFAAGEHVILRPQVRVRGANANECPEEISSP